jgi:hypothetical protein
MGLTIEWIGNFNPFNFIKCPLCGGKDFISLSTSGVWCSRCATSFSVRHTAGDPGCVVDALMTEDTMGPKYNCLKCEKSTASFAENPTCTVCGSIMEKDNGYWSCFSEDQREKWYMILKIGDYCSGWIQSGGKTLEESYSHPSCKDRTLQKKWDDFQKKEGFFIDPGKKLRGIRFVTL